MRYAWLLLLTVTLGCDTSGTELKPDRAGGAVLMMQAHFSDQSEPTPEPTPDGECDNCNGTGWVGDGVTMFPCSECNEDEHIPRPRQPEVPVKPEPELNGEEQWQKAWSMARAYGKDVLVVLSPTIDERITVFGADPEGIEDRFTLCCLLLDEQWNDEQTVGEFWDTAKPMVVRYNTDTREASIVKNPKSLLETK